MSAFAMVKTTAERVSQAAARDVFQGSPVPKGTLLMSFKLTIVRTAVLDIDAYHNEAIIAIHPKPGIDRDFLRFYLPTIDFRTHQDRAVKGQTLNRGKIDALPVLVPPLDEQRRIAAVLRALRARFETQEEIGAALGRLKAATMAKLFREGLRGEPLKQTEIGEIPRSWEVVQLRRVAQVERGKFAHRPRNDPRFYGGTTPFIQTGDVARSSGSIRTHDQTLNDRGLEVSRVFQKGTIVLTIAANIADTGILEFDSAFPDSLVGITPGESMDARFLELYLRTQKAEMNRLAPKGTQKNINIQFLEPWPTPRPPLEEQRSIARWIKTIDGRLLIADAGYAGLRNLFSSTLNLLMAGQVRVPPGLIDEKLRARPSAKPALEVIEEIVRRIVETVAPDKIVLFGSVVPGSPSATRGVGVLVVVPFEGRSLAKAIEIERDVGPQIPLEILVRRPEDVNRALQSGDPFIKGIVERGRLMHASAVARAQEPPSPRPVRRGAVSEEVLREIVQRIVEVAAPRKIVLFGSAARGEMGPDSDIDLLVVTETDQPRETAQRIRQRLIGVPPGVSKDVIVVTPEHLEHHKDTIGFIFRPALREGRVLHVA